MFSPFPWASRPPARRARAFALLVVALLSLPARPSAAQAPFADGQAAATVLGSASFTSLLSAASLNAPVAVAVDATRGKVYVTDELNHRVLRYGSLSALQNAQPAERVFGQPDFGSSLPNRGGAPGANTLNSPNGIAVDAAGRLYVADVGNHRVLRFDDAATGTSSGPDADRVFGQANVASGAGNRGASVDANTLDTPMGVAVDAAGRLYVADYNNHRVLRFDDAGTGSSHGPGANLVFGQYDFASNLENATLPELPNAPGSNTLRFPNAVAVDADGRLYVSDQFNNRVLRFDAAGTGTSNMPDANRVFGQADLYSGGANRYGSVGTATLSFPSGVAVDADGRLYVVDAASHRVVRYDNAGTSVDNGPHASRVFGQPGFFTDAPNRASTVDANTLSNAKGVAVDAAGRLYVADYGNHRVLRFDDAGTGSSSGPGADRVLGRSRFTTGNANSVGGGVSGLGGLAAVAVDAVRGKVYVADQMNHRVLRYGSLSALQNGQPAERVFGQADFVSTGYNRNGFAGPNTLALPAGVAVDAAGRLYVADYGNNRVLRFDDAATGIANGPSASRVFGQADFVSRESNGGAGIANARVNTLNNPTSVAVDGAGRLYVADYNNSRVLRFDDASTGASNGPDAARVFGQETFVANVSNRGGNPGANTLSYPSGVAVDAAGRLYVAEQANHRVVRFDEAGTGTSNGPDASRVFGQATFAGGEGNRGGSVGAGTMAVPKGIAVDGAGRLYVADYNNSRVLRFDDASTGASNGPEASGVLGQADFVSASSNRGGSMGATTLAFPVAVAVDNVTGQLLVGDAANERVLVYTANGSLPVELVAFTAAASGRAARLAWTTESETNNAGFTVERQSGTGQSGAAWVDASGFIAGRGTTTERSHYAVDVENLSAGRHTFRLRQSDTDGAVHYSASVAVEIGTGGAARVTVLGGRGVRIETGAVEAVTVTVFDVLGRAVETHRLEIAGTADVRIGAGLATGQYVVRVAGERFAETRAFVVR